VAENNPRASLKDPAGIVIKWSTAMWKNNISETAYKKKKNPSIEH
jgi:hypothetical protein